MNKILTQIDISSRYILSYGDETEVLRIATQPTFGARWLVPRLKGFGDRYPRIHLDIRNELEPFDLVQAKADIAFFSARAPGPGQPASNCSARKWCRCAARSCWPTTGSTAPRR